MFTPGKRHGGLWVKTMILLLSVFIPSKSDAARRALAADYVIQNWQTEEGLPENSATSMARTPDGYIWFGTFGGLVRFDGVDFKIYDSLNTPELPSRSIVNLHLDRSGVLWISSAHRLTFYKDGKFTLLPEDSGWASDFVLSFSETAGGELFLTAFDGGIYRFTDGRFEPLPRPGGGEDWRGVRGAVDGLGNFYCIVVGETNSFFGKWTGSQWEQLELGFTLSLDHATIGPSPNGDVWVVADEGLFRISDGRIVGERRLPEPLPSVWGVHPDSDGNVWVSTFADGVFRIDPDGNIFLFDETNVLPYNSVRFVSVDPEGNRWIGTTGGGLLRLVPRQVANIGVEEGLDERVVKSVAGLPDGGVAIGTFGDGVSIWKHGVLQKLKFPDGISPYVQSLGVDAAGRLWIGTYLQGVFIWDGDEVRQLWTEGGSGRSAYAILKDSSDRMWVAGKKGVTIVDQQSMRTIPNPTGSNDESFRALLETDDGMIWAGGANGLFRLEADEFVPFGAVNGLANDDIFALERDPDGGIWIGTAVNGLSRLKDDEVFVFDEHHNLPVRTITGLKLDAGGRLWLASNRGIHSVSMNNLNEVADGRTHELNVASFGVDDGMVSQECAGGQFPTIAVTADGRLWFATLKGVASVDPLDARPNVIPPVVLLDEFRYQILSAPAPGSWPVVEVISVAGNDDPVIELPPGARQLEIRFTAIHYYHPEHLTFQIKLAGVDPDWVDIGTRRSATYNELPPGRYHFLVRARSPEGLYSLASADLRFNVSPYYWETGWFRYGGAILLLGLIGGTAWWIARSKFAEQSSLFEERQRFFQVLENTSDAVAFVSPERVVFYINKAGRKLLGMDEDGRLTKLTPEDIYTKETYEKITNEVLPYIRQGRIWTGYSQVKNRSGEVIPVWQVIMMHYRKDGSPDFVSSVARDMTEIRRAEEALRVSEDKFSKAFHNSPDSISITRVSDGHLLEVNDGFTRTFGWKAEDAIHRTTPDLGLYSDPEDRNRLLHLLEADGRVRNLEAKFVRKDGSHGIGLMSVESIDLQGEDCLVTIVRDISDRKAAEAELQASRNMLQQVLDSIPVRVFWKSLDNVYLGSNAVFARDVGKESPEEILGLTDFDISAEDQALRHREDDLDVIRSGTARLNYEEPHQDAAGNLRWLRTSKVPLRSAHGEVVGVLGVYEDITERKTNEEDVLASRNMLKQVMDSIPVRVFWKDRDCRFLGANSLCAQDSGFSNPDDMIGLNDFNVGDPEDAERYRTDDLWVMESGESKLSFEEPKTSPELGRRWMRTSKAPIRDSNGNIIGLLGVYEDITSRKLVERALKESEQKLRLALDASSMGVWEWKIADGKVIWSDHVAAIFGLKPGEFDGTLEDYESRVHPADRPFIKKRIEDTLNIPETEYQIEHRVVRPDGSLRWVEARGTVDREASGAPVRMSGTVWDITSRKTVEQNLLQIARGVSGAHGQELHRQIVRTLASVVGADMAFLGRVDSKGTVQAETSWSNERFGEPFQYELKNSPCVNVVGKQICVYASDVQTQFPLDEGLVRFGAQAYAGAPLMGSDGRSLGLLVAMFKTPLTRPAEVESVLNILAAAAIADFERSAAHEQLQKANLDLEERVRDRTNELQRLVNLMAGREVRMAELKSELRDLKKGSTDAT